MTKRPESTIERRQAHVDPRDAEWREESHERALESRRVPAPPGWVSADKIPLAADAGRYAWVIQSAKAGLAGIVQAVTPADSPSASFEAAPAPSRAKREEDCTTRIYHRTPSEGPSIEIELTELSYDEPSVTAQIPEAELVSLLSHSKTEQAPPVECAPSVQAPARDGSADAITLGELEDFRKQLVHEPPSSEAAAATSEPLPSTPSPRELEAAPALAIVEVEPKVEPNLLLEPDPALGEALARFQIVVRAPDASRGARALAVLRSIPVTLFARLSAARRKLRQGYELLLRTLRVRRPST